MVKKLNERNQARNVLKDALMLIPNFLKLLYRLFKDHRVPLAEKALVVGTIAYVVSPLDIIPDVIPFVGQVDDLYLIALVIVRLLSRTSDDVMREHWDGAGDVTNVVNKVMSAAQYILPKRVRQILIGRVEIAPQIKGGLIVSPSAPESIEEAKKRKLSRG